MLILCSCVVLIAVAGAQQTPTLSVTNVDALTGNCQPPNLAEISYTYFRVIYPGFEPSKVINIRRSLITCESVGRVENTFSSVTVLIEYICIGSACGGGRIPEGVLTDQFTVSCQLGNNRYEVNNYVTSSAYSVESAVMSERGRCGTCSSNLGHHTGCVGMSCLH